MSGTVEKDEKTTGEADRKNNVNILVNGTSLSFTLDPYKESIMREAAQRLNEAENSFRINAKLSDERDYFRYAALLVASNLVRLERESKDLEKTMDDRLDEILKIVDKY